MNERLQNALGKMPVFSGLSYRCLTVEDGAVPHAFVTAGVLPATLQPSGLMRVPGVRVVMVFLNRTARDVSLLAAGGPEVAIMPECAFRTVGEVEFPHSLTVRIVEEIVEPGRPDPEWPGDLTAIMNQVTAALAAPQELGNMSRFSGVFAFIPVVGE